MSSHLQRFFTARVASAVQARTSLQQHALLSPSRSLFSTPHSATATQTALPKPLPAPSQLQPILRAASTAPARRRRGVLASAALRLGTAAASLLFIARAGIAAAVYTVPGHYKDEMREYDLYTEYRAGRAPPPRWLAERLPPTTADVIAANANASISSHINSSNADDLSSIDAEYTGPTIAARPPGSSVTVPAALAALLPAEAVASINRGLLSVDRRLTTLSYVTKIMADFTFIFSRRKLNGVPMRDGTGRDDNGSRIPSATNTSASTHTNTNTHTNTDYNTNTNTSANASRSNGGTTSATASDLTAAAPQPVATNGDAAMESDSALRTAAASGELSASAKRLHELQALHYRTARRLLLLAAAQGGAYVKAAQHIASIGHGFPAVYKDILSLMQDRAPALALPAVRATVRAEFSGRELETLFREFDPAPVAAASLAQVHRAVTHDGQEVAVKVQYPYLRGVTEADVATMALAVRLVHRRFPKFEGEWMVREFAQNLRRELDFVSEAASSERIAALFGDRDDIYIPAVRWDLTTPRVLVTEFIHGCRIADADALRAWGLQPQQVMDSFVRAFAEMIFSFGFVHCDPHPGNVLVRPRPADAVASANAVSGVSLGGGHTYDRVFASATLLALPPRDDVDANALALSHSDSSSSHLRSRHSAPAVTVSNVSELAPSLFRSVSVCAPPPTRLRALVAIALACPRSPPGPLPFERLAAQLAFKRAHSHQSTSTSSGSSGGWGSSVAGVVSAGTAALLRRIWGGSWQRPQHQVVLLDHGLYRELDPQFRRGMAQMFTSLYRRDPDGVREGAKLVGAEKQWRLLSLALAHRLPTSTSATRSRVSAEDRAVIVKEFRGLDITQFVSQMHPDLVFVLKTLNLVRSVNRDLEGSRVRRLALMFDQAVAGAAVPAAPLASNRDELLAALPVYAPYAAAVLALERQQQQQLGGSASVPDSDSSCSVTACESHGGSAVPEGMVLIDVRTTPAVGLGAGITVGLKRVALRVAFLVYEAWIATVTEGPEAED